MTQRRLEVVKNPDPPVAPTMSVDTLGMSIFLGSLTVVFVASLIAYFWVRLSAPFWRDATMPPMPRGLLASTVVIIGASLAVHMALRAARRNDQRALRTGLVGTLVAGLVFMGLQIANWRQLVQADLPPTSKSLYAFTFYMLTGLHAAHVVGGLVPLVLVTRKAYAGAYSSVYHRGVLYQAMYWHFLDAVWLVLFGVLQWAG